MSQPASYCRGAAVDASVVSDRVILFERESRRTVVLNPTGTALWDLLVVPQSTQDLAAHLQARFSTVSPEQVRGDVEAYLDEMLKYQFIQAVS